MHFYDYHCNRPFLSCPLHLLQNESLCKTLRMKMSCFVFFFLHENERAGKTQFHMNGFSQRPILAMRHKDNSEMVYKL